MAAVQDESGNLIVSGDKGRQFLTEIIESGHDSEIMNYLYKETARVIMLVRERLERERPVEGKLEKIIEGETA